MYDTLDCLRGYVRDRLRAVRRALQLPLFCLFDGVPAPWGQERRKQNGRGFPAKPLRERRAAVLIFSALYPLPVRKHDRNIQRTAESLNKPLKLRELEIIATELICEISLRLPRTGGKFALRDVLLYHSDFQFFGQVYHLATSAYIL